MKYNMTEPCDACPFIKGSGFRLQRLRQFAANEFPCHKASDLVDTEDGVGEFHEKRNGKTPHCAGALIFNEKRGEPHQMMRICERIGMYDHTKLNMNAPVGTTASDFKRTSTGSANG